MDDRRMDAAGVENPDDRVTTLLLPDARPVSDRFRCGGCGSEFPAANQTSKNSLELQEKPPYWATMRLPPSNVSILNPSSSKIMSTAQNSFQSPGTFLKLSAIAVTAGIALATAAQAETYTWASSTVGGEWNTPANWGAAVYPNAAGDIAVFNNGKATYAITIASPVTVGEIRQPDAWERMRYISSFSGNGSIIFDNGTAEAIYNGSYRQGHFAFTMDVPMVLNSNLTFMDRAQEDWTFPKEISGPGRLTLLLGVEVPNNNTTYYLNLNTANSYQGGTVIGSRIANPWNTEFGATVRANADGALGPGDVELITHSTQVGSVGKLRITSSGGAEDRIADTASLRLNFDPIGGYTPVTLDAGVDETVNALYFGGEQQASGTWGATGSLDKDGNPPTNINDNYFFGAGILRIGASPPLFQITRIVRNPGTVTLTFPSTNGATYTVESSTDLTEWTELDDSVNGQPGETEYTDDSFDPASGVGWVFYRVARNP